MSILDAALLSERMYENFGKGKFLPTNWNLIASKQNFSNAFKANAFKNRSYSQVSRNIRN